MTITAQNGEIAGGGGGNYTLNLARNRYSHNAACATSSVAAPLAFLPQMGALYESEGNTVIKLNINTCKGSNREENNNMRKHTWKAAVSAAAICVAAALSSWAIDNPVAADYTLTEDETVDAALTVNSGVTVDLAGHKLTVKGLGTAAGTITSTVAGGVLEIDVDSGTTVDNSAVELTGGANLQVWKSGDGTLKMTKVNSGFGGEGVTSLVVKAGIVIRDTGTNATATFGANNSTIVVENGAQFDVANKAGTTYYDFVLEGAGPAGNAHPGALVNNQKSVSGAYNTVFNIRNITLSGDTLTGGQYAFSLKYKSDWQPHTLTMNGHTLTITNVTLYAGSMNFVGEGKIDVYSSLSFYQHSLAASNCEVTVYNYIVENMGGFSAVKSLVFETGSILHDNQSSHARNYIFEKYAPPMTFDSYQHLHVTLGNAEHLATTLDLSRFSDTFDGSTTTFYAGSTVNVDAGSREIAVGNKLVSWSAVPDATFTLTTTVPDLAVVAKDDGLYVKSSLEPAYATRNVAGSSWNYWLADGTSYPGEWDGGITSTMDVHFSTAAEWASIAADMPTTSPYSYILTVSDVTEWADVFASAQWSDLLERENVVIDVNGGHLSIPETMIGGTNAFTVTSSAVGGVIEVGVAAGHSVTNTAVELTGGANLQVWKTGAGTLGMTKVNSGFGGEGVTSLVIKAGIVQRDTGTTARATFGANNSTIVVEDGGQFDIANNSGGVYYDFVLAGAGPDGLGALALRPTSISGNGYDNAYSIRHITLSADAAIGTNSKIGLKYTGDYADHNVTLNNHTLTLTNGTVYAGAFTVVGGGRIVVGENASFSFYRHNVSAPDCDVIVYGTIRENADVSPVAGGFSAVKSLVFETGSRLSDDKTKHMTNVIYERYAPPMTFGGSYKHLNVTLGNAEHLATSLDLTRFTGAFDGTTTTFYTGSTATVDLAGRADLWTISKSASPYIITWSAVPENVTFVPDEQTGKAGYRLIPESTGLKLECHKGFIICFY